MSKIIVLVHLYRPSLTPDSINRTLRIKYFSKMTKSSMHISILQADILLSNSLILKVTVIKAEEYKTVA